MVSTRTIQVILSDTSAWDSYDRYSTELKNISKLKIVAAFLPPLPRNAAIRPSLSSKG